MTKQVVVDNELIDYAVYGSGHKTVVAVHGWADNGQTFKKLSLEIGDDFTVYAMSLPGQRGASEKAYDISSYVLIVGEFARKLKLDVDMLIGHSNGGAIAIKAVSRQVIKPKRLVLIASAGVREDRQVKKRALAGLAKLPKAGIGLLPDAVGLKIKKKAYSALGSDYYVSAGSQDTFKAVVAEDVVGLTSDVNVPVLAIVGSQDEAAPVRFSKALIANMKNSELAIIEGGDHFIHQNDSRKVAQHIKGWV